MTFGNKRHLVVFHCTSSGLNGADLGSDENEIVFLVYLIIDLQTKKVGGCIHISMGSITYNCCAALIRYKYNHSN